MRLQQHRHRARPQALTVCVQLLGLSCTAAFSGPFFRSGSPPLPPLRGQTSQRRQRLFSICAVPRTSSLSDPFESSDAATDDSKSSFWYSVAAESDNESVARLPCDRDLDQDGELPPGAYMTRNKQQDVENKKTCRISVALGLFSGRDDDELAPAQLVSQLNAFVDAGLTSFHVLSPSSNQPEGMAEDIIQKFKRETPAYQTDRCHFTLPFDMPTQVSALSVRNSVLELLRRTGGHDIDCIQLQYKQDSSYCFEVLDYLQELQRDGFVRSVRAAKMPETVIRQAQAYGFSIDSNTIPCNLLDPLDFENRAADASVPLILSSPLAAGLLTERYYQTGKSPLTPKPRSSAEQQYLKNTLPAWKQRHDEAIRATMRLRRDPYADDNTGEQRRLLSLTAWSSYQEIVLETIRTISFKHGVSMASVVLRWTLQLDQAAGTVVTSRFSGTDRDSLSKRPRQLRQVFTFALDEHDMELLWQVTGCRAPGENDEEEQSRLASFDDDDDEGMKKPQANGLFLSPRTRTSSRDKQKTLFL